MSCHTLKPNAKKFTKTLILFKKKKKFFGNFPFVTKN